MYFFKKKMIACKIELHWRRIRHLKKRAVSTASRKKKQRLLQRSLLLRYEAKQLSRLYDVLCGVRHYDNTFVHPPVKTEADPIRFSKTA